MLTHYSSNQTTNNRDALQMRKEDIDFMWKKKKKTDDNFQQKDCYQCNFETL